MHARVGRFITRTNFRGRMRIGEEVTPMGPRSNPSWSTNCPSPLLAAFMPDFDDDDSGEKMAAACAAALKTPKVACGSEFEARTQLNAPAAIAVIDADCGIARDVDETGRCKGRSGNRDATVRIIGAARDLPNETRIGRDRQRLDVV